MVKLNNLMGIVLTLVLVGMIIGVGILVFNSFGQAAKVDTTVTNESVTIDAVGRDNLTYDEVQSITWFGNQTVNTTSGDIVIGTDVNVTSGGELTVRLANFTAGPQGVTYVYLKDSETTSAMGNMTAAVSPISTTWLPLIVTVTILGLILSIVIASFQFRQRR